MYTGRNAFLISFVALLPLYAGCGNGCRDYVHAECACREEAGSASAEEWCSDEEMNGECGAWTPFPGKVYDAPDYPCYADAIRSGECTTEEAMDRTLESADDRCAVPLG